MLLSPTPENIAQAAAALRAGQLVAFPTETVYGLGADAENDAAVAAIYAAKGRPQFNPLIAHAADANLLNKLVVFSDLAHELATRFWPGPLTLVLPRQPQAPISLLASAGLPSLAVRIPAHPVARALLSAFGGAVVAPSANRSGSISATTPAHVVTSLGEAAPLVLAAGACPVGVESTILDLTGPSPILRRPGGLSREQLEPFTGPLPLQQNNTSPNSPGQLLSHYAPRQPVRLNVTLANADEAYLLFGPELGLKGGKVRRNLSPTGDLHEAAAHLFRYLHELEATDCTAIAVSPIPQQGLGAAINDRLQRAAAPRDTH